MLTFYKIHKAVLGNQDLFAYADVPQFSLSDKAVECFRTDAQRFGSLHRGENVGVILKHLQFLLS
jgi:hypothetical protein